MTIRTAWVITSATISCVAVGLLGFALSQKVATAEAAIVPRTIVLLEQITEGADTYPSARYTYALRSDGAESFTKVRLDREGGNAATLRKVTFPGGRSFYVRPDLSIKATVQLPEQAEAYLPSRDPASGCRNGARRPLMLNPEPSYTEETLNGLRVVVATTSNGGLLLKQWFSPGQGCELVRQVAEFYSADRRLTGVSTQILEAIRMGEPDPSLFDDKGAVEKRPSDVLACSGNCLASLEEGRRLDQIYEKHRAAR